MSGATEAWCVLVSLLRATVQLTYFQRPHWIPYFDDVQAIIFLAPLAFNLMLEEDAKVNRLVCHTNSSRARPRLSHVTGGFHYALARDLRESATRGRHAHLVLQQGMPFLSTSPCSSSISGNQMDILQATLAAGIRVQKYVPSYGDQPNDVTHVVKCESPFCICAIARADSSSPQISATSSAGITYVPLFSTVGRSVDPVSLLQKRLSPKPRPFYCHETSVVVRIPD